MIEKGTADDLDELEKLYDELNDYLASTVNYPGWIKGVYPIRETAEQSVRHGDLFVLRMDGIIAGSVILNHEQEEAYDQATWGVEADYKDIIVVRTLVVHPRYMNKGVGSELMNFARQYSLSSGMKAIRLDVSVNNTAAIKLYEKAGYSYIGTVDLGLVYEHLKWFKLYELIL